MKARYALGIDGGGSKCEAVLLREDGSAAGRGLGGPIHSYYDPPEVIAASFRTAIQGALGGISGIALSVAGQVPRQGILSEALAGRGEVIAQRPTREEESAYASAQAEYGLVVCGGTGSFVHGRTRVGKDLHFGGAGPVLGDYGSAYAIGLAGLRAAFASHWTAARQTSLAEAIPQALGVADLHAVFHLVYVEQINRRRIAALARAVDAEAERGDQVARRCLLDAADALADTGVELVRELGMSAEEFPLLPMGAVARQSRLWWERVQERITEAAPRAFLLLPRVPPAAGAALLALREIGVAWSDDVIARLLASMEDRRETR